MRVPRVSLRGEVALRGDVIDIFPYGLPEGEAVRILLDFDRVADIRNFNPVTQASTARLSSLTLAPSRELVFDQGLLAVLTAALEEPSGPDQAEELAVRVAEGRDIPEHGEAKRVITLGTKIDAPGAAENLSVLLELKPGLKPVRPVSVETGAGLEPLPALFFRVLDVVRVYSKLPGKEAELRDPFTLPRGSTVTDFARAVHRELAEEFTYARIWGSELYEGQTVSREHELQDGNIIEIHV